MIKILFSLIIVAVLIWGVSWFFFCEKVEEGRDCTISLKFNTSNFVDKVANGLTGLGGQIDLTEGEAEEESSQEEEETAQ